MPYKIGAFMQDELLQNSRLIIYPGFSHGILTVNPDVVNADILKFCSRVNWRARAGLSGSRVIRV